ncbi:peptide ABC transporter substrate-binding protein [Nocardia yunnanensis]|uniref:Peptide ABC transporter substrate-binding protein n=1 Tax=Nocardia yunnanensis TaxID=2382165 RepID=A0A386Z6U5_9NOCA|nr:ABC transporter substrate-binding protein [Nocardia yunnanensis]AYF73326.1 peptide ABC transporter substrate-binding protein [Nocardia yunnanensis]
MRAKRVAAAGFAGLAVFAIAGCGSGKTNDSGGGAGILVGTTDKVTSLDPAKAYDNGSLLVETQVYQFLMNFAPGETVPKPDAADKCGFTSPTVYSCTLKPGLKFANGDPLTAQSVKFSFDRMVSINDPQGPAVLLDNLDHTDAPDDKTVNFTLKKANDQTFPSILPTQAAAIVDEKVFAKDRVLTDDEVVKGKPFSGPYTISSYDQNKLAEFKSNPDYNGLFGKPKTDTVTVKYYAEAANLKLDVQQGNIDVAWHTLSATDLDSLKGNDKVTVHQAPGGDTRYIVFNLNTQPGGNPAQKLAIRKAVSTSVDRDALATNVFKGTWAPLYSPVPKGVAGGTEPIKDIYGAKPNKDMAAKFLADAGVATPVELNLQYTSEHYGPSSSEEYAAIKSQLEATGLFKVNLQSTEWVAYQKARSTDGYPMFQFGWFPDYPDADDYLRPFFTEDNFLRNHFGDPKITAELNAELTEQDPAKRATALATVQHDLMADYMPIVPLLTGNQIAVAGKNVQNVDATLDPTSKFRFGVLSK